MAGGRCGDPGPAARGFGSSARCGCAVDGVGLDWRRLLVYGVDVLRQPGHNACPLVVQYLFRHPADRRTGFRGGTVDGGIDCAAVGTVLVRPGASRRVRVMTSDIKRVQDNLRDELNGAALYTALAAAEADPVRKDLFLQLAKAEASHAQFWREKLAAAGVEQADFVPDFRTRLLARLARRFGPGFVLPTVAA